MSPANRSSGARLRRVLQLAVDNNQSERWRSTRLTEMNTGLNELIRTNSTDQCRV